MSNQDEAKKYFFEGIKLYSKKDYSGAINEFEKSLRISPDRPSILLNLAKTYFKINNFKNAEKNLEILISLKGHDQEKKEALNLLLEVYLKLDDVNGINKLRKISYLENYFDNYSKLQIQMFYPRFFDTFKEIEITRNNYEKNIDSLLSNEKLPKLSLDEDLIYTPNFPLSYDGHDNLKINNKLTILYKKIYQMLNKENNFKIEKNDKIKIGFISEFFTNHTILKLFQGIIYKLDKSKFEVFVFFSDKTLPGNRYDEIKRNCIIHNYQNVFLPKDFEEKVRSIKNVNLDILFYTDIHMSKDLFFLTLLKLAKFQITSWGHPETTGNEKIDFFLSSELLETNNYQKRYSEKVLLSKYLPMYFYKPKLNKSLSEDLISKNNIYSCPQNLMKMHPTFDTAIKKILDIDKKAKIYFIKDTNEIMTKKFFQRLKKQISTNMDRVIFTDKYDVDGFINHCGRSSVLLDPFIFGAGNSFHESMYYGTPTVTMPTEYLKSRIVLGAYKQMKIDNPPVAKNIDEYVDMCVQLANSNIEIKENYRESANKYLFENENVIRDLEEIFENIVNE